MLTQKTAKDTVHQLQERIHDKALDIKDDVQEAAHKAGVKVREAYDNASEETRDVVAATEKQIRRHPFAAGAIAAGVGFVLGALLRRRA